MKFIMDKFNKARKLFGSVDLSSNSSVDPVIYLSSDDETSDRWNSDWSTDTEEMMRRVETKVVSSPMLIAGRIMTSGSMEVGMVAGRSTSQPQVDRTLKLDKRYYAEKMCYAPQRGPSKSAIELCRTLIPVEVSPMSPPPHERGPTMETPVMQVVSLTFRVIFHIQDSVPYDNVSEKRCKGCLVCG